MGPEGENVLKSGYPETRLGLKVSSGARGRKRSDKPSVTQPCQGMRLEVQAAGDPG